MGFFNNIAKSLSKTKLSKKKQMKPDLLEPEAYPIDEGDAQSDFSDDSVCPVSPAPCGEPVKLFASDENLQDKLVGVVVTIFEGSSYDEIFRESKPSTVPGERVSTYSISCKQVELLLGYLTGSCLLPEDQPMWGNLCQDVSQVDPDSVVFNWECCSGCGDHQFPCTACPRVVGGSRRHQRPQTRVSVSPTTRFMGLALRRGHTVMCSDFSLKSLMFEWSEEELGPNSFLKVGECSDQFQLEFVPTDLQHEEVPQQLQVVGELCKDAGKAVVQAMPSTILYTVNPKRQRTGLYDLKILTVMTDSGDGLSGCRAENMCSIGVGAGLRRGLAGHVTLTYASGGQLVTSMGHWIELTRINTTLESVLRVAAHEFGTEECDSLRQEYASKTTDAERYECVQKRAHSMVQKSVPSRMKCRTKY